METVNTAGHLYLVGVGPGDPELMTYKAVRILKSTPVWAVPKARSNGTSSALAIVGGLIDTHEKTIIELSFIMKKVVLGAQVDPEQAEAWKTSADEVIALLDKGQDVAFPTLGDVGMYSTAFYLLTMILERRPDTRVTIIPGITAMSACAAGMNMPLALGDDVLAVVPATFEDERLRSILTSLDAVILMKVYRRMDELIDLLTELDLLNHATLIERCGMPDEHVYTDIRETRGKKLHYFSTMLIRKKHYRCTQ
ncbi:precorrin-2 C(20)-methyltransferase [Desulfogranum japonicum]|uniref:precorrin-2 C(20)-methyltransferase n=1 Tax=Desulfogranum japonicum TaxID=231447 RepID=UPI00040AC3E8|nr:precorrin-2 C(20)-methyltransferase [Desulfogranum japonicum]